MNIEETKNKIQEILKNSLPKEIQIYVRTRKILSEESIFIGLACSDENINMVEWQKPQLVSLCLFQDWELCPTHIAGSGGIRIYRKPDMNHPTEKYLAMKGEKVPFRKPQQNEKAVLKAVERFAQRYIDTLCKHKEVLMYDRIVDYSFLKCASLA